MDEKASARVVPVVRELARDLRKVQTPAEQALWRCLRRRQLGGYYFRRQHPIGHFVVDFLCAEASLIVEVDGDVHATQEAYDTARTEWLEARGYRVVRFTNREVRGQLDAVLESILAKCREIFPALDLA